MKKFDIYERAFKFAVRIARLVDTFPSKIAAREYAKQLIRSSASIGANIAEADGVLTRKDFINKIGIARREARESVHWLKLIGATNIFETKTNGQNLKLLEKEAKELTLILSSIIKNTENKKNSE